jgi:hypothetical protein
MKKENNNRRYPGESRPRPDNAKFRREEAAKRQADYDKLSIEQKLAKLDEKLGPGQGAERQRARLMAQLEKKLNPTPAPEKEVPATEESEKQHMKAKDRRAQERKRD